MGLLTFLLLTVSSKADTGVLLPRDHQTPDPAILSLEEMSLDITIDNGDAHIHIVQIFANHTGNIEEGTYRFALPTAATVSDFAVWDGPVRIPAVILERKRAEQIYAQARLQAIDPGLLQAGERDDQDTTQNRSQTAIFTAKIVPIPAYGTKRLELDYHQRLATTDFAQRFILPLKPDAGQTQTVASFRLHFVLHSATAIDNVQTSTHFFGTPTQTPHDLETTFQAQKLPLDEDLTVSWHLAQSAADKLEVITHRDPHAPLPNAGEASSLPPGSLPLMSSRSEAKASASALSSPPEPGFFAAQLLLADPPAPAPQPEQSPRTVLLLFDNSLSMQWDKLERSYAALEATLHSLKPADHFNVFLFNQAVTPFKPSPIPAAPADIQQALDFIRQSKLRGGTDLLKALEAALAQSSANTSLALFTDGGSDRGETVVPAKIAARYATAWKGTPTHPHTNIFAVGDDANRTLLRALASNNGFMEQVLSTEPIDFHLQSWLSKLNHTPVAGLALAAPASTSLVYPLDDTVYPGSIAQWVGQYKPSATPATFTASATRAGQPVTAKATTAFPESDPSHPELPRLWAQARVDALLAQIDRDGESAALIDEIIRLSRRYKFVTPYTSFLAVPRSLLRPRVIRPGDPVLRVRTDPAITSVIAVFPFGLTKPLRHLVSEDEQPTKPVASNQSDANRLWETRFLAPPDMRDGTYTVRLLLRDTHGNTYNEAKTFVIASTTPTVRLQLSSTTLHRGQALEIKAAASQSTRTLIAHLEGAAPVTLRWNPRLLTNTGTLVIPPDLPTGRYTLILTAEDIAHNQATQEAKIDVLP